MTYSGLIPTHDPAATAEAGRALARLDEMAKQVPLDARCEAPRALAWDSMTFQNWMDQGDSAAGYPYPVYTHSAGSIEALINTTGGAQQDRMVGGTGC